MADIENQIRVGGGETDMNSSGSASSSSQVVEQIIGGQNDYLIRLLERALDNKITLKPVVDKLKPIATKLEQEITSSRGKADLPSLLINTLLREKLNDRSAVEGNQKQKTILIVLMVILPLVTNLCQFILTYMISPYARDGTGSS